MIQSFLYSGSTLLYLVVQFLGVKIKVNLSKKKINMLAHALSLPEPIKKRGRKKKKGKEKIMPSLVATMHIYFLGIIPKLSFELFMILDFTYFMILLS